MMTTQMEPKGGKPLHTRIQKQRPVSTCLTHDNTHENTRGEELTKRGEIDGERTDDEAQTPRLRLFVMVRFASQTTRW
jgi:hypothetical protein